MIDTESVVGPTTAPGVCCIHPDAQSRGSDCDLNSGHECGSEAMVHVTHVEWRDGVAAEPYESPRSLGKEQSAVPECDRSGDGGREMKEEANRPPPVRRGGMGARPSSSATPGSGTQRVRRGDEGDLWVFAQLSQRRVARVEVGYLSGPSDAAAGERNRQICS
jgi:hypothetical protein